MAVLYLDADDEITSAAARIRATEDDRIAVVLPYGSRLATSRINFRLLAREATERGKTIEVIAADASARALAMTAGLTVHPSVAAFEGGVNDSREAGASNGVTRSAAGGQLVVAPPTTVVPVPPGDDAATSVILVPKARREPVPVVGRVRPPVRPRVAIAIGLAVLAVVAILGFVAFTALPSASIVLAPWSIAIGPLQLDVVADPGATAADPATLRIPAQAFSFDLAANQTFNATGVKVTDTKATGSVTFANFDTGRGVLIPSGTTVRTASGIQFQTVASLTLPAATVDFFPPFATHPSTGSVGIVAVIAGPSGNVGNNTITIVSKGGKNLKVSNPDATSGGDHSEGPQVTQADVDAAIATLTAALPAELDQQVAQASNVPSGMTIYPATKEVGTATPTVDPKSLVGLQQATFDLGLTAKGSVVGVEAAQVQSLAEARLGTLQTPGYTLDQGSISVQVGTPTIVGQVVTFPVTLSARKVHDLDRVALLAEIRGLDLPAARARLDDYGAVEVRLWPDWVTTIPTNLDRVTLTIDDPKPQPSPSP